MRNPNTTSRRDDDLAAELIVDLERSARALAPAFVRTMPDAYFNTTTQAMRLAHFKAILAADSTDLRQTVYVRDADGQHHTFISNADRPGQLAEYVRRLPRNQPLSSAKVFTSSDGEFVLDVFTFGENIGFDACDEAQRLKVAEFRRFAAIQDSAVFQVGTERHLESCDAGYLLSTPAHHLYRHWRVAEGLRETGDMLVAREAVESTELSRLTIASVDVDSRELFERISAHLGRRNINIRSAYLDKFADSERSIVIVTVIIDDTAATGSDAAEQWDGVEYELRRLPWLDAAVFEIADTVTGNDLLRAEILCALTHLAHQKLCSTDSLLFARERIIAIAGRHPEIANEIVESFVARFDADRRRPDSAALRARIASDCDESAAATVLAEMLLAVEATLRSNHGLSDRRALALRLDPEYLRPASGATGEHPFGVFFVVGNRFTGFHVRFRDIARGGVRIVRASGQEQFTRETERHFSEAWDLALAQQFKNKDIPEGGAKAVILAAPDANFEAVGQAFADGLLDLVLWGQQQASHRLDYYGNDEMLYLGPDENISNALIVWIAERARYRGHPMPGTFMSSKPGAGINHKQYGVTSEGVTVFLEHALNHVGIDPRSRPFTVKMTGGPDGDVAGNQIAIMHREFGSNVKITGISDGSGCAEDPEGLDMDELLRLVQAELPIAYFDVERLSTQGRLVSLDAPNGFTLRNSLHNRIQADALIPAGGRPGTINESNWQKFLDVEGRPSARVIVEGANLFITPEARLKLAERGVTIIKDSSANKAGVICSSLEILASMLSDESRFLEVKEAFVGEVLTKLRALAKAEARALFREKRRRSGVPLPVLSERISKAINKATDVIHANIDVLMSSHPAQMRSLLLEYVPSSLLAEEHEQALRRIPAPYANRIAASALASKIVYREGLEWLESMSDDGIVELASQYAVEESGVREIICQIRNSDLPNRERIAHLLELGGTAAAIKAREWQDRLKDGGGSDSEPVPCAVRETHER